MAQAGEKTCFVHSCRFRVPALKSALSLASVSVNRLNDIPPFPLGLFEYIRVEATIFGWVHFPDAAGNSTYIDLYFCHGGGISCAGRGWQQQGATDSGG